MLALLNFTYTQIVKYPITIAQIREMYPDVSLPAQLDAARLFELHVVDVTPVDKPVVNELLQSVAEVWPTQSGGDWIQTWLVQDHDVSYAAQMLSNARDSIWSRLKETRTSRILDGGVNVSGDWYHTDLISRTQYVQLASKADKLTALSEPGTTVLTTSAGPVYWKLMDNRFVVMTIDRIHAVVQAIENQEAATFAKAEQFKALVYASTDPNSVDIQTGWPVIYTD